MEIRLWRELLVPYELAVKELVMKFQQLKKEHKEKDLYCPIEEVSGRVKSINSILEKMQRKQISWDDLEEKVMRLQQILPNLEGETGVLDMQNYSDDRKNVTFRRDD